MFNRRDFLATLTGLTALGVTPSCKAQTVKKAEDVLGEILPLRKLGKTGVSVTMLGVGGQHIGRMNEAAAEETVKASLKSGIRFFDTAETYQRGNSETLYGKFLTPKYRKEVFLMTKTKGRDGETVRRHLRESLERLKTDYLDLWQMHDVVSVQDVDNRIKNGVIEAMTEAKKSGKVKHLGFTGHVTPKAHLRVLEKTDVFEVCQMPINVVDPSYESFILKVLPELTKRDIGVLAMKTLAGGGFFGGGRNGAAGDKNQVVPDRVKLTDAINFVYSLPVACLISGVDNAAQMTENAGYAKNFKPLNEAERKKLIELAADLAGNRVEFYKA